MLKGLRGSEVVVGVNGDKYDDKLPWRPTFYPGTADRAIASRIKAGELSSRSGIDITLPPPREPAVLHIVAELEDGTPATGFGANVRDLSGIQRAFVAPKEGRQDSSLDAHVFLGETYRINCFRTHVVADPPPGDMRFRAHLTSWSGLSDPVQVNAKEVIVHVILREEKR